MTYGALRTLVQTFINKTNVTVTEAGQFINLAKAKLQRDFPLNWGLTKTTLSYSTGGVALPADFRGFPSYWAVTLLGDGQARTPLAASSWEGEQRRYGTNDPTIRFYVTNFDDSPVLVTAPEQDGKSLEVVYSKWLPDYSDASSEDMLLRIAPDVLLVGAIEFYNLFVHDEDRIPLNEKLVAASRVQLATLVGRLRSTSAPIDED